MARVKGREGGGLRAWEGEERRAEVCLCCDVFCVALCACASWLSIYWDVLFVFFLCCFALTQVSVVREYCLFLRRTCVARSVNMRWS